MMYRLVLGVCLLMSTLSVKADSQTNQFDDLVYPPAQSSMMPLPGYGANSNLPLVPQPFGYIAPYNMSSYPHSYNPYPNGNGQAINQPSTRQSSEPNRTRKPWGDVRHIWPDFYTEQTNELWDRMINAPHDMGYMPGGWRFPSLSTPDPVTVGDAVANQVPPIMEEVPNFMNFAN